VTGPYARPLPVSLDLIWSVLAPLHASIAAALTTMGLSTVVVDAVVELLLWGEFVAVGFAVVILSRSLRSTARTSATTAAIAGLIAIALVVWTLRHATLHLHELFVRPDHLLLAGALGIALEPLPAAARRGVLAGLSALILGWLYGAIALAVVAGSGLAGVGAAALIGRARRQLLIASQAAVVIGVVAVAFWLRSRQPMAAVAIHGLAFFILLRHVSWAVEFAGGVAPNVVDYCHYLLFYPGSAGMIGGPEVFAEFRQRNLVRPPLQPDSRLWRQLAWGALYVWLSRRIRLPLETVVASDDSFVLWALQGIYWVEVALYLMGVWCVVDAVSLLLGVRLRQNFAHLLQAENPSDLWRSVRGTMTYWLVYHVYRPLGGNRGSQELHVMAALAVSWIWHLVGVPFLAAPATLLHYAPFTLWTVVTGAALVGHIRARQHGLRILPATTPIALRRAVHRVLTLLLASLAVTLPWFQVGGNVNQFGRFVGVLFGFAPE
jgi:hypothetical protein